MAAASQEKSQWSSRVGNDVHSGHYFGSGNDDDSGCATEEYAWTPPGLTLEMVRLVALLSYLRWNTRHISCNNLI